MATRPEQGGASTPSAALQEAEARVEQFRSQRKAGDNDPAVEIIWMR